MQNTFTLSQFEHIDGLLNALQNRGPLRHTAMTRNAIRSWSMHEWLLTDALVELLGLEHVQSFASAEDCAADFICRCMSSASLVEAA